MKEEFDKILKDSINEQIKAPEKLKNRIRQEIRQMDKKKKKTTLVKTMQGIAAVVVVGILSVTSYAAVTGNLSLQNMGFLKASKNYSENAVEVNKVIENKYLKYTLNNVACDNTYLITESTIDLKDYAIEQYGEVKYDEKTKNYIISIDLNTFVNNEKIYPWGTDIQKVGDKEYKFVEIYDVSDIQEKDLNFELDILSVRLNSENEIEANQADDTIDDVFTEVKSISIMQEISMDIKREESRKKKFKEISQTVGNKTIVVKEAANTNFSTIIKASIITEESYDEYSKNEDEILDYNNFLVTQGNGDDISYEVYEDTNTYAITDDGNMFTVNDLYDYMSNQKDDKEFASIIGGILGTVRDSKVLSYDQIVEKYGNDENLNQKVVKIQKNYTIKIGNRENGEDVKKVKLLPIKKEFLNDRNGEEEDLYNNVKWYNLENKKFVATSELGGTLEITSIDITDDKIIFNYNTKGLIGEDDLILMRNNIGKYNLFYPEKVEEKGLSSNENRMIFARTNNTAAYTMSFNIPMEEEGDLLNDISKDEFTMLFGKENGTQIIGDGLMIDVPNKITDKVSIENINTEDISGTWYEKEKNDDRLFSAIDDSNTSDNNFGAGDTNSVENDYVQQDENALTVEEYNKLFNNARSNLEKISSNESKMNKDTASISGIKIGISIDEVHRILEDEHYEVEGDEEFRREQYIEGPTVVYEKKNNIFCVTSISINDGFKTDVGIKVGDSEENVIRSYAKDENLFKIRKNLYDNGWVLYGDEKAADIKDVEGYVINDEGGQNAYYLLNSYIDGYSEEDYSRRTILYFDDDVCMEYYIYDGVVCEISLFIAEDMPES